ncbi:hypothetical protein ACE1CD_06245 [Aerosakkonema sp. BLCC-F183]|uniref:hypothetical protein n=1 Tax=Aerosakkonema sp. BLCC-F183 TaxID=3342834 RepID=UPI0035B768CF
MGFSRVVNPWLSSGTRAVTGFAATNVPDRVPPPTRRPGKPSAESPEFESFASIGIVKLFEKIVSSDVKQMAAIIFLLKMTLDILLGSQLALYLILDLF